MDAWSVGGGSALALFGAKFAGIETKLFQAGLAPYLAYLYFLGKRETGTPRVSLFGARFLLLFVIATIPAGIVAKTTYGDILANVDALHGSSETLLSVSNFLFAFGFADALAKEAEKTRAGAGADEDEPRLAPPLALLAFAALAGGGSYGAGQAIHSESAMRFLAETAHARAEPANALSAQTWAVHVSSVAEWAVAMRLVKRYAERGQHPKPNRKWRYLPVAMTPFLASGFAACVFHAFYNPPSINALVPLQALLTFLGNAGCACAAFAAYRESASGEKTVRLPEDDSARASFLLETRDAKTDATPNAKVLDGGDARADAVAPSGAPLSSVVAFASFVVVGSSACVVTPLVAGDFFFEPSYDKALAMIAAPTLLWAASVFVASSDEDAFAEDARAADASKDASSEEEPSGFARVKEYGAAGVASYVIVELAFWATALPVAVAWYRVAEGTWLDMSLPADKAKLLGAGAVFINGVRFFVPFRLAAALALAPAVRRTFFKADEAKADEAKADEAKADEAKADEAKADEARR